MSCFPAAMHFILWPMHTRMYKQVQLETFMLIQIMSGSLNLSLKKLTDIPCNVCLLAPNSLSFCLSCNVLICLYFFIDKWVKKKIQANKVPVSLMSRFTRIPSGKKRLTMMAFLSPPWNIYKNPSSANGIHRTHCHDVAPHPFLYSQNISMFLRK